MLSPVLLVCTVCSALMCSRIWDDQISFSVENLKGFGEVGMFVLLHKFKPHQIVFAHYFDYCYVIMYNLSPRGTSQQNDLTGFCVMWNT